MSFVRISVRWLLVSDENHVRQYVEKPHFKGFLKNASKTRASGIKPDAFKFQSISCRFHYTVL